MYLLAGELQNKEFNFKTLFELLDTDVSFFHIQLLHRNDRGCSD